MGIFRKKKTYDNEPIQGASGDQWPGQSVTLVPNGTKGGLLSKEELESKGWKFPMVPLESTNPKDLIGDKKIDMTQVPPVALIHENMAMMDGTWKYGYRNWREKKVQARIYIAACMRHLEAWLEGEEAAEDSGVHHLGHARACLGILLDAQESGNLVDDRVPGAFSKVLKRMEQWVTDRKKKYENKPIVKGAATIGDTVSSTFLAAPDIPGYEFKGHH